MDVVLKLRGIKKEEIKEIVFENGQIVLTVSDKKYYFAIKKKVGTYFVVGKETKAIQYECHPIKSNEQTPPDE